MIGQEIYNSLTPNQKEELNQDIASIINGFQLNPEILDKGETDANLRLEDEVYLNITLKFQMEPKGSITATLIKIFKYKSIDEYIDAVNKIKIG